MGSAKKNYEKFVSMVVDRVFPSDSFRSYVYTLVYAHRPEAAILAIYASLHRKLFRARYVSFLFNVHESCALVGPSEILVFKYVVLVSVATSLPLYGCRYPGF